MFGGAGASERWLWQQGGRDAREGGGVQGSLFLGCGAVQWHRLWLVHWMLWGANILGFGDRISWLAATRGCPAPAPELLLLGITAALLSVLEEPGEDLQVFLSPFFYWQVSQPNWELRGVPYPCSQAEDLSYEKLRGGHCHSQSPVPVCGCCQERGQEHTLCVSVCVITAKSADLLGELGGTAGQS